MATATTDRKTSKPAPKAPTGRCDLTLDPLANSILDCQNDQNDARPSGVTL